MLTLSGLAVIFAWLEGPEQQRAAIDLAPVVWPCTCIWSWAHTAVSSLPMQLHRLLNTAQEFSHVFVLGSPLEWFVNRHTPAIWHPYPKHMLRFVQGISLTPRPRQLTALSTRVHRDDLSVTVPGTKRHWDKWEYQCRCSTDDSSRILINWSLISLAHNYQGLLLHRSRVSSILSPDRLRCSNKVIIGTISRLWEGNTMRWTTPPSLPWESSLLCPHICILKGKQIAWLIHPLLLRTRRLLCLYILLQNICILYLKCTTS